jgi:hypothetical protein
MCIKQESCKTFYRECPVLIKKWNIILMEIVTSKLVVRSVPKKSLLRLLKLSVVLFNRDAQSFERIFFPKKMLNHFWQSSGKQHFFLVIFVFHVKFWTFKTRPVLKSFTNCGKGLGPMLSTFRNIFT